MVLAKQDGTKIKEFNPLGLLKNNKCKDLRAHLWPIQLDGPGSDANLCPEGHNLIFLARNQERLDPLARDLIARTAVNLLGKDFSSPSAACEISVNLKEGEAGSNRGVTIGTAIFQS